MYANRFSSSIFSDRLQIKMEIAQGLLREVEEKVRPSQWIGRLGAEGVAVCLPPGFPRDTHGEPKVSNPVFWF